MPGSLDPNFTRLADALRNGAKGSADALIGQGDFKSEVLASENTPAPDPADPQKVHEHFNRDKLAEQYRSTIESPEKNKLNTAIAAKLQSDWMAAAERDYKMLYGTSRVRAHTMAAGRRYAHGHDNGPIAKGVVYHPQSILELSPDQPQE